MTVRQVKEARSSFKRWGLCLYSSTLQVPTKSHKTPEVSHSNTWHVNNHSLLNSLTSITPGQPITKDLPSSSLAS